MNCRESGKRKGCTSVEKLLGFVVVLALAVAIAACVAIAIVAQRQGTCQISYQQARTHSLFCSTVCIFEINM